MLSDLNQLTRRELEAKMDELLDLQNNQTVPKYNAEIQRIRRELDAMDEQERAA